MCVGLRGGEGRGLRDTQCACIARALRGNCICLWVGGGEGERIEVPGESLFLKAINNGIKISAKK